MLSAVAQVNAQGEKKVAAILDDGRRFEGDLLIGADGIWSKVHYICAPGIHGNQGCLLVKACYLDGVRL